MLNKKQVKKKTSQKFHDLTFIYIKFKIAKAKLFFN